MIHVNKYPSHLKRVVTLPCELFVQKNCSDQSSVKLTPKHDCHLKQFIKNIHPIMLASFLFTDKKTFTAKTPKNPQVINCMHIHQPRRKTT